MSRDISPGCRETCVRDVLNQHTVSPTMPMSRDIGDSRTRIWVRLFVIFGLVLWVCDGVGGRCGFQGDLAEEFAGEGIDDPGLEVLNERVDPGAQP